MPLTEGVDYTIESGLYVFTKAYLLRRGTCCGSGCRNCPYRPVTPPPGGDSTDDRPREPGAPTRDTRRFGW